ncbi:MAG: LysR family transcriptional regulator [Rhodobacteraceae bacterium]|nr:LysR family transcriptional regulator [Paracoccaceae bacterium]
MQEFDWTLIQSFLAVAEKGSFTAAARTSNSSQPTIGRHIQQLQEQLGSVLFQRGEKGYVLTQTGLDLFEHAKAMRASAARISLVAEGQAEDVAGTVRITASEIIATFVMPVVLAKLIAAEPLLQIELVATNSTENLLLREADIAVRMVRPDQQSLFSRKLGDISLGMFAATSYLRQRGIPETFEALKQHTLLGYDRSDLLINGMLELGFTVDRNSFAFRADNQVVYMEALKAGMGIGASQVSLAEQAGLVRLFPDMPIEPLPVWLTAHNELRTSARVRRVFDFLANELIPQLR